MKNGYQRDTVYKIDISQKTFVTGQWRDHETKIQCKGKPPLNLRI